MVPVLLQLGKNSCWSIDSYLASGEFTAQLVRSTKGKSQYREFNKSIAVFPHKRMSAKKPPGANVEYESFVYLLQEITITLYSFFNWQTL